MKRATAILATMLLFASACPLLGPKSEETDDVADETEPTPAPAQADDASPASASTSTEGGLTCEDELATMRAALSECQSSK